MMRTNKTNASQVVLILAPAGKDADLAAFDVKDYREIPYWFGANHCAMTVLNGLVSSPA